MCSLIDKRQHRERHTGMRSSVGTRQAALPNRMRRRFPKERLSRALKELVFWFSVLFFNNYSGMNFIFSLFSPLVFFYYFLHASILFQILFPCRLLHNTEQHSLCYTVGLGWLSILNISVRTSIWIPRGRGGGGRSWKVGIDIYAL